MDPIIHEWGSLLLRWLHMITAMAWIGSSFYFMHLDASLKPASDIPAGKGGETWEVHGGGFYQVRKYLVAPDHLPPELIWHKWQSYSTWLSGFFLLGWIYYGYPELYLIDPAVRALTPLSAAAIGLGALALGWIVYDMLCRSPLGRNDVALGVVGFAYMLAVAYFFQIMFSGRGAFIHTGAVMATIMTANVFFVIIPNQKKVIADLMAGRAPDPALGKMGKQRSTHNNYLTLPVVFLMISNHYPLAHSSPYAWVIVGLVLIAGALVRVFYNIRHSGKGDPWWTWGVAALCIVAAAVLSMLGTPAGRERFGLAPLPARPEPTDTASVGGDPSAKQRFLAAAGVIQSRCSMCHAREPVWAGIAVPPKGVILENTDDVLRWREAIRMQAVLTHAMPPNNITELPKEERAVLAAWLAR